MQDVFLNRLTTDVNQGTLGILLIESIRPWIALEPPWRENARWTGDFDKVSCIPLGTYLCKQTYHPRFGATWEVVDVPGRDGILFHIGNYRTDTMGCILLAERWSHGAVLDSRIAMERFRETLEKAREFRLVIRGDHATFGYSTPQD